MTDLYYLSQADGIGEWRMKEAKDLSDLVQNRITYLQVSTDTPAAEPTGLYHFTHKHTQRCRRHNYAVSIDANIFFTQINAHMHTPEISFALARLICTVHICQHQFAQLAGDWYDSRRFQQLQAENLFVSSLVSPTHMRQKRKVTDQQMWICENVKKSQCTTITDTNAHTHQESQRCTYTYRPAHAQLKTRDAFTRFSCPAPLLQLWCCRVPGRGVVVRHHALQH